MTERATTVVGGPSLGLAVYLDVVTGMPVRLQTWDGDEPRWLELSVRFTASVGGQDDPTRPVRRTYVNATALAGPSEAMELLVRNDGDLGSVCVGHGVTEGWTWQWRLVLRPEAPRLAMDVALIPPADGSRHTVRDLTVAVAVPLPDADGWVLESPGNAVRTALPVARLDDPVGVSSAGGLLGSSGLVALHRSTPDLTALWWPLSEDEIGAQTVTWGDGTVGLRLDTGLAGDLSEGDRLAYRSLHLDLRPTTWTETLQGRPEWFERLRLSTPDDTPVWVRSASIFEVQVGESVFGDFRYAPYPRLTDLLADLPRIADLGFDALQLMPRQPYPSYNVHDYADVETSYGPPDVLLALIEQAHALGLRVLLDVLLHGVVDREAVRKVTESVRHGHLAGRLGTPTTRPWGTSADAEEQRDIAWARHILDFEAAWTAGAPEQHPLLARHPEWFMRDHVQDVTGIYSHAFDVANREWQDYFIGAMEDLLVTLDVDGFRFDAPTYNAIPDWSEHRRGHASHSALGSLELFRRMRPRLRRLKPHVMLYTEPSGVLFRRDVDVTYNYDEQWLVPAVLDAAGPDGATAMSGRDLASWFAARDALLPAGSTTAHHVDSHDTFWWPLPGHKWRREQFGPAATAALLAVFGLSGGVLMAFVGAEERLTGEYSTLNRLRRRPELGLGRADYAGVTVDDDRVYAVVRRAGPHATLVLVNVSDAVVSATVSLTAEDGVPEHVEDLWAGAPVVGAAQGPSRSALTLRMEGFQVRVLPLH